MTHIRNYNPWEERFAIVCRQFKEDNEKWLREKAEKEAHAQQNNDNKKTDKE